MTRRIVLVAVATVTLVVVAFLVPLLAAVTQVGAARAEAAASAEAQSLAPVVAGLGAPAGRQPDADELARLVRVLNERGGRRFTVFLADGRAVGAAAERGEAARLAARGRGFTAAEPDGSRSIYVPVTPGAADSSVILARVPRAELERDVPAARSTLVGLALAALAAAVAVSGLLGRSLARPLLAVAEAAGQLRRGRLDHRATPAGPPEVRRIAETLNRLADRIGELLQAERESAADVSHRIRTPLTRLRLAAESLRDPEDSDRLLADISEVERTITHVITQVRRPAAAPRDTDLVSVVAERMDFWSALAEEQARPTVAQLPSRPRQVPVGAEDLAAALDALIGNVFAHTPPGTPFTVVVPDSGVPSVTVLDDGPGVGGRAADVLARGASGGMSSGLGLDIARRTAEAAGGRLELVDRTPCGVRATLVLGRTPDGASPASGPGGRRAARHRHRAGRGVVEPTE